MSATSAATFNTERVVVLRRFPGFTELEPAVISMLAEHMRERFFPAGTVLFNEGEPVKKPLLMVYGKVSVFRHGHRLRTLEGPASVGMISALAGGTEGIYAVADEDVFAYETDSCVMFEIMEDNFVLMRNGFLQLARTLIEARLQFDEGAGFQTKDPGLPIPDQAMDVVQRLMHLRQVILVAEGRIDALAEMARECVEVRFDEGTTVWREGDHADYVLFLVAGRFDCRNQKGQTFSFVGRDVVGGLDSLAEVPRWYTAWAATSCVALRMDGEVFLDVLEDNTEIALGLTKGMAAGVDGLYERLAGHEPEEEPEWPRRPPE